MADKITIDTHTLDHIPEEHRDSAEEYTCPVNVYTQKDFDHNEIPEGKEIGDVREEAHTRWRVTYEE